MFQNAFKYRASVSDRVPCVCISLDISWSWLKGIDCNMSHFLFDTVGVAVFCEPLLLPFISRRNPPAQFFVSSRRTVSQQLIPHLYYIIILLRWLNHSRELSSTHIYLNCLLVFISSVHLNNMSLLSELIKGNRLYYYTFPVH